MEISVVIPAYNEEQSIIPLVRSILKVLNRITNHYEIIFVDDGSTDSTFNLIKSIHRKNRKIKVIKFRKNFGQTAAMSAGFKIAKGKKIITLDADMQNDPSDIPILLRELNKGYDVVSGWRHNRKDPFSKKIISRGARLVRKLLTKEPLHDLGCTLKVYRKECLDGLNLYGEMHRFIPTLLRWRGYKIGEVKVSHHPRRFGRTKYSFSRVIHGFMDLLSAKFLLEYSTRPFHFFAFLGSFFLLVGSSAVFFGLIKNIILFNKLSVGPLLLPAVLFVLSGVQFILFGLLSELQIRSFYSRKGIEPYNIEQILK